MSWRRAPAILSPYDSIAEFYRTAWAGWYLPSVLPALERLLFSALPSGAAVLDLCCGCGHITQELAARGYDVTGLDSSAELIGRASKLLPRSRFMVADARDFVLDRRFDGALSTFDSLNHLLSYSDLASAFRCVKRILKAGAPFFFDMNLEEAYSLDLGNWSRHSEENEIGFVRGIYNPATRRGTTEVICFFREPRSSLWQRVDSAIEEQCYSIEEISGALRDADFRKIETYTAAEAGVTDELGFGRLYVRAWA
jgi:SAM-dependent methyltransferase